MNSTYIERQGGCVIVIKKSPSGALSPYYYKGGYFHGIHYGSYFHDEEALFEMMQKEEEFIIRAKQPRRILIDLYETDITPCVLEHLRMHLIALKDCIVKLAIATDRSSLKKIKKMVAGDEKLQEICVFFHPDMETGKTWLVSDKG